MTHGNDGTDGRTDYARAMTLAMTYFNDCVDFDGVDVDGVDVGNDIFQ